MHYLVSGLLFVLWLLLVAAAIGVVFRRRPMQRAERWMAFAGFVQLMIPVLLAAAVVTTYDYDYYVFRSARDELLGCGLLLVPLLIGLPLYLRAGRMKIAVALNCLAAMDLCMVFLVLCSTADKDF